MAIDFNSGSNSAFPRFGRMGKVLYGRAGAQAADRTAIDDLLSRYPVADEDLSAALAGGREGAVRAIPGSVLGTLRTLAESTLIRMVAADQPTRAGDKFTAMQEFIRQMVAGGVTVKASTIGLTAATLAGVTGSQVLVSSKTRGDGKDSELLVAEAGQVRCAADSRTGGQRAGAERYQYYGVPSAPATPADYDWPKGSGANTPFTGASALISNDTNKLTNGGWDGTWVSVTPPNWTKSGTIALETSTVYSTGASSFKVAIGDTPILTQAFGNATTGTAFLPSPLSSLGFCLFGRALTSAPAAGVLRVELWSTGGVVNDATGSPARVDFTLASSLPVANTWYSLSGIVRTPAVLPAGLSIRVNVQTASDVSLFFDHMALTPLVAGYPGGPGLAVFAGDVPALVGDGWTLTGTNNRGGATYPSGTFQSLFEILFGMAAMGLQLNSTGAPSIADTLITS